MLAAMIDGRRLFDVIRPSIHAHAHETALADILPESLVLLLSPALQRSCHIKPGSLRKSHDFVDDLVGRLRADGNIAVRAVWLAQARVQNPQIVVDLSYGADSRTRTLAGGFLL